MVSTELKREEPALKGASGAMLILAVSMGRARRSVARRLACFPVGHEFLDSIQQKLESTIGARRSDAPYQLSISKMRMAGASAWGGATTVHCLSGAILAMALGLFSISAAEPSPVRSETIGRPVRIASFSFSPGKELAQVLQAIETQGARGVDLIVLPETWKGQDDRSMETVDGPIVQTLSALAKRHRTYIICPLDIERQGRRFNTALVIDRTGRLVAQYDKVFPYWSEYDLKRPVQPGGEAPVFETDFGRIGIAICFDVNFPEVWQQLADRGAELVIWPSAYSAGKHLQAYALLHHYYIVTATYTGDCQVYDITGEQILDDRGSGLHASRVTLDLDRGIYHSNFNDMDGFLRKHGESVHMEKFLEREAWYVLRAAKPGVSARRLARQFGLEELRDYIARSRIAINEKRGGTLPLTAGQKK